MSPYFCFLNYKNMYTSIYLPLGVILRIRDKLINISGITKWSILAATITTTPTTTNNNTTTINTADYPGFFPFCNCFHSLLHVSLYLVQCFYLDRCLINNELILSISLLMIWLYRLIFISSFHYKPFKSPQKQMIPF